MVTQTAEEMFMALGFINVLKKGGERR